MMIPDEDTLKHLAIIVRHHDVVVTWIEDMYRRELEALPYQTEHLARSQGRCQFAGELLKAFAHANEAAK